MVGESLTSQERCTCKGDVVGIRKSRMHILGKLLVLRAVRLVHQDKDVIAVGQERVFLGLVILELMYQGEHHRLVTSQEVTQLGGILRLAFFLVANDLGTHKCLVYLCIQVLTVGNDKEGKVAMQLALHLSHEHHHRIALARALGVPEHTKLAIQRLSALHVLHQIVDTKILVVLGDDFDALVIKKDEVLDIVEETVLAEETVYQVLNAQSVFGDLLTVEFLFFIIHTQPLEEEFIATVPGTYLGLQTVAQHTDLVEGKNIRDVLAIAGEVFVIRFLHLDGRVLQFDEYHRQSIHEEQHVGTAIAIMPFYPHLVDAMEVVALGMVEVDESHNVEILLAVLANRLLDAIA